MTPVAVTSADSVEVTGEPPPGRQRAIAIAAIVAVAVPLAVLLVRVLTSGWISFSDWAPIELRTRDVGTSHNPLLGPYSRYGWSHPGPLMYYALALPYRVVASRGIGLLAGTLLVNTAALVCIGIVLWRRGRLAGLLVGGAVVLLMVRALPGDFLVNPWNPYIIVFPILAVFACCWAAIDGDSRWALPVAIAIASFAIQTHVGSAAGVAIPIVVAIVYCVVDARNEGDLARFRRTALITLTVGVVCWIPPIVQQFTSSDGNLSQLWDFWSQSHDRVTGWSDGARLVQPQLTLPAPWFTGHEARNAFDGGSIDAGWHVPWALFLLIAALVVALRRGDRQSTRLCVLALSFIDGAFIAAARIIGQPIDYIVRWLWLVGVVTWLAIAWTAIRAFAAAPKRRRIVTWAAAAVFGALAVALVVSMSTTGIVNPNNDQRSLRMLARSARPALKTLDEPVLIETPADLQSGTIASGILALALHEGVDARLPKGLENVVGSDHVITSEKVGSRITVATNDTVGQYANDPAYRVLASYDPLTPAERHERDVLRYEAGVAGASGPDGQREWIRNHPKEIARLQSFDKRGLRIAIFERVSQ